MIWFVLISVYYVLTYSTVPVAGQSTSSSCAVFVSGPAEESHQVSLEELDHRLQTVNQNMCSVFEKLEVAMNRTNARGREELCQDLKMLYYNMSVNLERVTENIPEKPEWLATHEQENYLSSMNSSLIAMIVRNDEHIQAVNESLSSTLQTVNRSLDEKFKVMQMQLSSLINDSVVAVLREIDQKFQTINEALSSVIDKIDEKLNATFDRVKESSQSVESQDPCRNTSIMCDCSDIKANGYTASGVYRIYVVDEGLRYYANASCDMTTTNGAWTVFQRRKNGNVTFHREWNEYANGFGNPSGEFWLGNNFLHLLTSKRRYRLRIDLADFEGGRRFAEYSTFNISSSADKYRLKIGTYSGTAGDSLSGDNGQRFTTKDNDNDEWPLNCASYFFGPWWYNRNCSDSNLNGLYLHGRYSSYGVFNGYEGINWDTWRSQWYSLKTTEMKISSA